MIEEKEYIDNYIHDALLYIGLLTSHRDQIKLLVEILVETLQTNHKIFQVLKI